MRVHRIRIEIPGGMRKKDLPDLLRLLKTLYTDEEATLDIEFHPRRRD